jgi:hypothetical protein
MTPEIGDDEPFPVRGTVMCISTLGRGDFAQSWAIDHGDLGWVLEIKDAETPSQNRKPS